MDQDTPPSASPEERIVLATVSCIERHGLQRLTVREIAKEAGVNSAAINYYFRSKEKLVARAMATTLDHLFADLEEIVADTTMSPRERIAEILDYLIDGATRYPGITKAHFSEALTRDGESAPFVQRLNALLGQARGLFSGSGRQDESSRRLDLELIDLISSAMLPAIMPSFYRQFSGIDFRDSRTRKSYVHAIMERAELGT